MQGTTKNFSGAESKCSWSSYPENKKMNLAFISQSIRVNEQGLSI